MALGLGAGAEQNAPLGRASIFNRHLKGKHQRDAQIAAVTMPGA